MPLRLPSPQPNPTPPPHPTAPTITIPPSLFSSPKHCTHGILEQRPPWSSALSLRSTAQHAALGLDHLPLAKSFSPSKFQLGLNLRFTLRVTLRNPKTSTPNPEERPPALRRPLQAAFGLVQHLALLGTAEAEGGVDPPTSLDDLCNLYSLPCGTAAAAARLAARPADNPGLLSRANLDPAALKHAGPAYCPAAWLLVESGPEGGGKKLPYGLPWPPCCGHCRGRASTHHSS